MRKIISLFLAFFLLSSLGCSWSPQLRQEIMDSRFDKAYADLARINNVGYSLLKASSSGKADQVAYLPFAWTGIGDTWGEYLGRSVLTSGREPVVIGSLPDFTPPNLDLRRGDQIVAFNGKKVTSTPQLRKMLKSLSGESSAKISFERDGAILTHEMPIYYFESAFNFGLSQEIAPYFCDYIEKDKTILISQSLVNLAESDSELSYILAHSLTHVIEGHKREVVVDKSHQTEDMIMYGPLTTMLMPRYKYAPFDLATEKDTNMQALQLMQRAGFSQQGQIDILSKLKQNNDVRLNIWSSEHVN